MSTPVPHFTAPGRPLTWLITGCSSGIGLALARHVLANGHRLIATSRNPAKTPELVREVTSYGDGSHRWVALDADNPDAGTVVSQLGVAIDVLVNNAGHAVLQTVEHAREADARALMETMFFGPLRLVQAVLPTMRRQRFGVVVYVSSGAGLEARPSMALYGAAKAAGDALTKTLAKEVAPFNVRALYVSLGSFQTNMPNATEVRSSAPATLQDRPASTDDDYANSVARQIMGHMASGGQAASAQGDPAKAARAIFEVATATGVGRGHEAEVLFPLGADAAVRVEEVRDTLAHALDVFGTVSNHVGVDDEWPGDKHAVTN
ncbi:short-chain oxidoreductase [Sporothrix schenckii 1099-18]|uniref:Short-chain oxidoreductase n=1 Tax=Sporothrix schenckii 1099-18 TaxID=1397361 RepID=A0A0F2MC99_SPOSC|nr:short-chain oxidoreductase [Sporothrix schenckii 1099-18]KJR86699.1 short-chain oxidoreductase [Sporothrix schenckii 1099-18]